MSPRHAVLHETLAALTQAADRLAATHAGTAALMQKQGITTNLDDWERQRDLRNAVGHDYPETSAIADILNAIRAATPQVLDYVDRLRGAYDRLQAPE
jgi:hypothetical protein